MADDPKPFNPLDKKNLGISVAEGMLQREAMSLSLAEAFVGAGIYAIYYVGDYPLYKPIARRNSRGRFDWPIYVGKADPKGARRGGADIAGYKGKALFNRLKRHVKSIEQASNLDIGDFYCRWLVVDDIWISLGESLLIEKLSPLWNQVLDGFGNNDPGKGRYNQEKSAWDALHPGRDWAVKRKDHKKSASELEAEVRKFMEDNKSSR